MNHMEKRDDETLTQWVERISPFRQDARTEAKIRRPRPPRRTLAELASSKDGFVFMGEASGIQGMKADAVIMDDPDAPCAPPVVWPTCRYEGGRVAVPADQNLPKGEAGEFAQADFSKVEARILAAYAAETESLAQRSLMYGWAADKVEADGTRTPVDLGGLTGGENKAVDLAELSNAGLDDFIKALVGSRKPATNGRYEQKRAGLYAAYGRKMKEASEALASREPVGGESLYDMMQRKLFEREAEALREGCARDARVSLHGVDALDALRALHGYPPADEVEASAEPVYTSQFSESVFNPTAGAWSGAGRIIDTGE